MGIKSRRSLDACHLIKVPRDLRLFRFQIHVLIMSFMALSNAHFFGAHTLASLEVTIGKCRRDGSVANRRSSRP